MTDERWQQLLEEFRAAEASVLGDKRQDYAPGVDRLTNFRTVAAFAGMTMSQVAYTYLLKHIQAIGIATAGPITPEQWCLTKPNGAEGLKQRVVDARNYLLLLAACIEEEAEAGL